MRAETREVKIAQESNFKTRLAYPGSAIINFNYRRLHLEAPGRYSRTACLHNVRGGSAKFMQRYINCIYSPEVLKRDALLQSLKHLVRFKSIVNNTQNCITHRRDTFIISNIIFHSQSAIKRKQDI